MIGNLGAFVSTYTKELSDMTGLITYSGLQSVEGNSHNDRVAGGRAKKKKVLALLKQREIKNIIVIITLSLSFSLSLPC